MMQSGILSLYTGALRADVSVLASLTHRDSKRDTELLDAIPVVEYTE
jgi:hypothetical protein